jgi:hypothetical protein
MADGALQAQCSLSNYTDTHRHTYACKAHEVVTRIANACAQVWTEGAKRPQAGNHHAAEVINNSLYLFGGLDAGVLGDCSCASCIVASSFVHTLWSHDRQAGTLWLPKQEANAEL